MCGQLGYYPVGFATSFFPKGSSTQKIVVDDTWCSGSELKLADCQHSKYAVSDCQHTEDVGVFCVDPYYGEPGGLPPQPPPTLSSPPHPCQPPRGHQPAVSCIWAGSLGYGTCAHPA